MSVDPMSGALDTPARVAWLDVSAGVSGDMLLGALVDAGADLAAIQAGVDAVIPETVRLVARSVLRFGMRATKVDVELLAPDQPHRSWAQIRDLVENTALEAPVRKVVLDAFRLLAEVEARIHQVALESVVFHEVGAWDSVADIVGVCTGLARLRVARVVMSRLGLGSGVVQTAHGTLPVPVPAVLALVRGWEVGPGTLGIPGIPETPETPGTPGTPGGLGALGGFGAGAAGEPGELTTPTGAALLRALYPIQGAIPAMTVIASGTGAGTRDTPNRPNVVRIILGDAAEPEETIGATSALQGPAAAAAPGPDPLATRTLVPAPDLDVREMIVLEANVDDLDPRVWPVVLDSLLAAGAADAWLTPISMKKGRPAHTLGVLAHPADAPALRDLVLDQTSTLGVRQQSVRRWALDRVWVDVEVDGIPVSVKIAHRGGVVVHAATELGDAAAAAHRLGRPLRDVIETVTAKSVESGIVRGAIVPGSARTTGTR